MLEIEKGCETPAALPRGCNSTVEFQPSMLTVAGSTPSRSVRIDTCSKEYIMHISTFLALQTQLKIMHWQTKSYAEHKALGKAYDALDDLIDTFVEVHAGKYGNTLAKTKFEFSALNYKDTSPLAVIDTAIGYLTTDLPLVLKEGDTDLKNIRDEMVSVLNRTKYLLRLN